MKNTKKLIAIAAAMLMALSPVATFADTIVGDANYVNTTVYKVTLPTTDGMSFLLDPQGLTSLDDKGSYDSTYAGKIVSEGQMIAKNESSVDVTLNADFYLVDSTSAAVTIIPTTGAITVDQTTSKQLQKEVQIYISTDAVSTPTVGVGTAAGAGTNFTMAAATYTYGGDAENGYTYNLTAGTGSTLKMEIMGTVAKDYDWSAYADGSETLTLHAVFGFKDASGNAIAAQPVAPTTAYAAFNDAGDTLWVNSTGTLETATGTITNASKLTSVKVCDKNGTLATVTYTVDSDWIKIKWDDMKTAGCTGSASAWTVEYVYDGVTYTADATFN